MADLPVIFPIFLKEGLAPCENELEPLSSKVTQYLMEGYKVLKSKHRWRFEETLGKSDMREATQLSL